MFILYFTTLTKALSRCEHHLAAICRLQGMYLLPVRIMHVQGELQVQTKPPAAHQTCGRSLHIAPLSCRLKQHC